MGRINISDLPPLRTKTCQIHRVHSFKLLGVYVDESLTWNCHIEYITAKVSKRLIIIIIIIQYLYCALKSCKGYRGAEILVECIKTFWTAQQFPEEFLYCNHTSNTRILFGCLWA